MYFQIKIMNIYEFHLLPRKNIGKFAVLFNTYNFSEIKIKIFINTLSTRAVKRYSTVPIFYMYKVVLQYIQSKCSHIIV